MLGYRRLRNYKLKRKYKFEIAKNIEVYILNTTPDFHLKYTKFNFGWGSVPDPAGGTHSLAEFGGEMVG